MPMTLKDEFKEQLKAAGLWSDFCHRREELRLGGMRPAAARDTALAEMMAVMTGGEKPEIAASRNSRENKAALADRPSSSNSSVTLESFGGRTETEKEIIRFVAGHMELSDVRPEDCPDPIAWNLLKFCQGSVAGKSEFWRTVFPKLLVGAKEEDDPGRIDGEATMGFIDHVLDEKRKAEAPSGVT